jgi:hypothetical protein
VHSVPEAFVVSRPGFPFVPDDVHPFAGRHGDKDNGTVAPGFLNSRLSYFEGAPNEQARSNARRILGCDFGWGIVEGFVIGDVVEFGVSLCGGGPGFDAADGGFHWRPL